MYPGNVLKYREDKLYYIGDIVLYNKNKYECVSVPEGEDCVTGEWDASYWKLYTTIAYKSLIKKNLNRFLKYQEPFTYKYICRYAKTRLVVDKYDSTLHHETVSNYDIVEDDSDTFITVTEREQNRLDIIASRVYGSSSYWWVIAVANNIIDSFDSIPAGTVLRVPQIKSMYKKDSILG